MSTTATPDAPIADSSPAPEAVPAPVPLDSLTKDQRDKWRLTGERPSTSDVPADSSPAPASDSPASTEASSVPASDAGKPSKSRRSNADTRKEELNAEIQALLKQRAELRQEVSRPAPAAVPAASAPAAGTPDPLMPNVAQPMLSEATFFAQFPDRPYGDYTVYAARYAVEQARHEDRQRAQMQERQREIASRGQAFQERMTSADPDIWTKVLPDIAALKPVDALSPQEPVTIANIVAQEIFISPIAPKLAIYLTDHPEDYRRLLTLSADGVIREMGRLEARLESGATPQPTLKTVTDAPPPPPSIYQRAAPPVDEVEAALAAGDFPRYKQAMNARDIAAAKSGIKHGS